jgi:porin
MTHLPILFVALCSFLIAAPLASAGDSVPNEWQTNYRSAGNRPVNPSFSESMREGPIGGVWQRSSLLGDPFGTRSWLGRYGIAFSAQETSEFLGNLSGGIHQTFAYDGLTTLDLRVDSKRAFGYKGGLFNASALDVHGMNLSLRNLYTQQTASGIEAEDGFRLWELWYQQTFDYQQFDLRLGLQSLDQEFIVSQNALLFVNTMFGWPMLTSADLLGGGPAYPLASLGARLHVQPMGSPFAFLLGAFDDNPAGVTPGSTDDSQQLDNHGTNFRLKDKPLAIVEVQFSRPATGEMQEAGETGVYPGTYKLGAWYDFGKFADQRYDTTGISLGDINNSNGVPALHQNNFSVYVVVDQLLWRESEESPKGLAFFFRGMAAPPKQNSIAFSANAGFALRAPFFHREYDAIGLGMGTASFSSAVNGLDNDSNFFKGTLNPVRTSETFLELTYQYQFVPWWQFQPDVQYVFNPGGGLVDPNRAPSRIANELVVGLRTNITL